MNPQSGMMKQVCYTMHTHTSPLRKIWADGPFTCGLMSDLVIYEQGKEYHHIWHWMFLLSNTTLLCSDNVSHNYVTYVMKRLHDTISICFQDNKDGILRCKLCEREFFGARAAPHIKAHITLKHRKPGKIRTVTVNKSLQNSSGNTFKYIFNFNNFYPGKVYDWLSTSMFVWF